MILQMDVLTDIRDWMLAVLKVWYGWLPSSAIAALIGYAQGITHWNPGPKIYILVLAAGFIFSVFMAWRKERVLNRNGPQLILEWDSPLNEPWDTIRIRNIGACTALCVRVGEFSWPDLQWHEPIEIQSIDNDENGVSREARFAQTKENGHEVGYMGRILQTSKNRAPLRIKVVFSDINRTEFTRIFFLQKGSYGGPPVLVVPGTIRMKRP